MGNILVIEDDADLLDLYRIVLQKQGRQIIATTDSFTALALLDDPSFKPDVVFLDINMNTGVSGLGIMQRIRQHPKLKDVPIVMATANDQYREYAMSQGVSAFLVKPIKITDLASWAARLGG